MWASGVEWVRSGWGSPIGIGVKRITAASGEMVDVRTMYWVI